MHLLWTECLCPPSSYVEILIASGLILSMCFALSVYHVEEIWHQPFLFLMRLTLIT